MFKVLRDLKKAFLKALEPNIQGEYRYGTHLMQPPAYALSGTEPFLALLAVSVDGKAQDLIYAPAEDGTIAILREKYPQATFIHDPDSTMGLRDQYAKQLEIAEAMAMAPPRM